MTMIAAGFQRDLVDEHRVELGLDAGFRENRLRVAIGLHVAHMAWHQQAHEVARFAEASFARDDDIVDVLVVEIANGALDQRAFLIDERWRGRFQRRLADGLPHAQQIFEIALDLGLGAARARRAQDDAHAFGNFELLGDRLQPLAIGRHR